MKRQTFNIIALIVWVVLVLLASLSLKSLIDYSEQMLPELGQWAFPAFAFCVILLLIFAQTILGDRYAPKEVRLEKDMTAAEKRERATREAALALKQGRKGSAMLIYEAAGMYTQAFELAQEIGDKPGLARLSSRLGHYSRARRLYLELKDYEAAAHVSVLLKELDTARQYYKQAAETGKGKGPEVQEAGLWDRAGEWQAAGGLYERAAELERAAECYHLMGDEKNSVRCLEQAKVVRALEEKQRGGSRQLRERQAEQLKAKAAKQAKEMEAQGDLLGAGFMYREAGQIMEAAMAFERFEDWERAAEAYDKAGLKNRADLARMHLEAKKEAAEEVARAAEAELGVAPLPSALPAAAFVPITRAQAVPVYLGVAGAPPVSPLARLEVCRRVRRGNFLEAAEFAKSAGDWVMAAAYYEHAGRHLEAADIYRQIGDVNAAAWCLEKVGRLRQAALLTLAVGQNERTVELLLKAIEENQDRQENAVTLGELLIRWGKHALALDILHRLIAPYGLDEANAEIYYRLARLLEGQRALREARNLYQEIIAGGAESREIREREAHVSALLAESPEAAPEAEKETEGGPPDPIDMMVRVAVQELAVVPETRKKPSREEAARTRVFQFTPELEVALVPGAALASGAPRTMALPAAELSLFGRPVGDVPTADGSSDADSEILEEVSDQAAAESDPFKPRQRYEIKAELGRGGMGVVYETIDTVLGRRVALKLILKEAANPKGYEQFLVEARAIALLSHPNVVIIYDVGLMDLQHYIAMEFVDGGNLRVLVKKEGALPLKEALRLFIEISRGLQAAHEGGIVHRDVKPANILLTEKHQVKISDFGLAKVRRETAAKDDRSPFEVSGTPGFMAPEQLRGAESHPRFDIYALGVTLFTMLVGKPPHEIADKTTLFDIVEFQKSGTHIPLRRFRPNAPEAIEKIYDYCTALHPEERYQSIDVFLPTVEKIYETL